MGAGAIITTIILFILDLVLIALVMFQPGKGQGMSGAITGAAETFLGKGNTKTIEVTLAKWTKILGIVMFVAILAMVLFIF